MNRQSLIFALSLLSLALNASADENTLKFDGATVMACQERFASHYGSHRCKEITREAECVDGAAVLVGEGLVAEKGRVKGFFIYTADGAYFTPIPERPEKFKNLVKDCLESGKYEKFFCNTLGFERRYFRLEIPAPSFPGGKRAIIVEYDEKKATITTFQNEAVARLHYRNGERVILESTPVASETWPGRARDVLLADLTTGIELVSQGKTLSRSNALSQADTESGEISADESASTIARDIKLIKRCLQLIEPNRKEYRKIAAVLPALQNRYRQLKSAADAQEGGGFAGAAGRTQASEKKAAR